MVAPADKVVGRAVVGRAVEIGLDTVDTADRAAGRRANTVAEQKGDTVVAQRGGTAVDSLVENETVRRRWRPTKL